MPAHPIDTAFVLGAGLGTRLRPLTNTLPKPLVPVCNKPLVTFALDHLIACGIRRAVINTHHLPDRYRLLFPDQTYRSLRLHFVHEPDILETAGGILNAAPLLGDRPFLVHNGDILTDLPLDRLIRHHCDQQHEVTLALRSKDGPLQVALDPESGRVTDIGGRLGARGHPLFLFTGAYILDPAFLKRIPARTKISVIPIFLEMIRSGAHLGGLVTDAGHWRDLGTRAQYLALHADIARGAWTFEPGVPTPGWPTWVHPDARVSPEATLSGATAVGPGCVVEAGARLHDCVLWPGAKAACGADLERCILFRPSSISGTFRDADL